MTKEEIEEEIKYWENWLKDEEYHIQKCDDKETLVLLNNRKKSAEKILKELKNCL